MHRLKPVGSSLGCCLGLQATQNVSGPLVPLCILQCILLRYPRECALTILRTLHHLVFTHHQALTCTCMPTNRYQGPTHQYPPARAYANTCVHTETQHSLRDFPAGIAQHPTKINPACSPSHCAALPQSNPRFAVSVAVPHSVGTWLSAAMSPLPEHTQCMDHPHTMS